MTTGGGGDGDRIKEAQGTVERIVLTAIDKMRPSDVVVFFVYFLSVVILAGLSYWGYYTTKEDMKAMKADIREDLRDVKGKLDRIDTGIQSKLEKIEFSENENGDKVQNIISSSFQGIHRRFDDAMSGNNYCRGYSNGNNGVGGSTQAPPMQTARK
jgi:hypothetical protein